MRFLLCSACLCMWACPSLAVRLLGAGIVTCAFLSGLSTVVSLSHCLLGLCPSLLFLSLVRAALCYSHCCLCALRLSGRSRISRWVLPLAVGPVLLDWFTMWVVGSVRLDGSFFGCLVLCFLMDSLSGWCFVRLDLHGSLGADGFPCVSWSLWKSRPRRLLFAFWFLPVCCFHNAGWFARPQRQRALRRSRS